MRTYYIKEKTETSGWDQANVLDIDNAQWVEDIGIRAHAQIMWDSSGLYLHLFTTEKDIRAEYHGPLSMISEDSCLEFFFQPIEYDARYFNFEVNPNGEFYIGFQIDRINAVRIKTGGLDDSRLNVKTNITEDGWEAYYKIPVEIIQLFFPGYNLVHGVRLRANCFKCGDKTKIPHYYSWNYVDNDYPDFQKHDYFGLMVLE